MAGILQGVNVLEIAQNVALPYCGRLLAGMGADVVKLEPPNGDAMRHGVTLPAPDGWGPEGKAYAAINVSKRSVCIDLDKADARPAVEALVRWADVVLVGLKPGDGARYGLDYDTVRALRPNVVYLELVPLGSAGPDAGLPGYDVLVQGRSGQSYVTARDHESGEFPLNTRPAYNDFGTSMLSALGVVGALLHRERTGRGQRVETALLGTAMAFMTPIAFEAPVVDAEPLADFLSDLETFRAAGASFRDQRGLYEDRVLPGAGFGALYFRHYKTSDGMISVGCLSAALFRRFHAATGLPSPPPRPGSPEWSEYLAKAEAVLASRTSGEWIATLREHGVPAGPCATPVEAMSDPQIVENGFVVDLEHDAFGSYRTTGVPVRFDDAPPGPLTPSPGLGHDTRAVLAEAGLDADTIETLFERQAVRGR